MFSQASAFPSTILLTDRQQTNKQRRIYLKKYKVYDTLCPANSYNANLAGTMQDFE